MAQRKIVWTKTADIQFVGVLQYWLERNKSNTYSKKFNSTRNRKNKTNCKNTLHAQIN